MTSSTEAESSDEEEAAASEQDSPSSEDLPPKKKRRSANDMLLGQLNGEIADLKVQQENERKAAEASSKSGIQAHKAEAKEKRNNLRDLHQRALQRANNKMEAKLQKLKKKHEETLARCEGDEKRNAVKMESLRSKKKLYKSLLEVAGFTKHDLQRTAVRIDTEMYSARRAFEMVHSCGDVVRRKAEQRQERAARRAQTARNR